MTNSQAVKQKSKRKQQLTRIQKAYNKLARASRRRKKLKRLKRIDKGLAVGTFSISRFHHAAMKFLAQWQQKQRGYFIDGFYKQALKEYFAIQEDIPKRMIKIDRQSVSLQMDAETIELLNSAAILAYKREVPTAKVIEEAVAFYLRKPENYLGKTFREKHPKQYEDLTSDNKQ